MVQDDAKDSSQRKAMGTEQKSRPPLPSNHYSSDISPLASYVAIERSRSAQVAGEQEDGAFGAAAEKESERFDRN